MPPAGRRQVRPPGAPDWERTAVGLAAGPLPPDYRAHEVLRRYPVLLARFAARPRAAGLEAARAGWRTVRVELADQLPPDAIEAAMTAYEREGSRLAAAARRRRGGGRRAARRDAGYRGCNDPCGFRPAGRRCPAATVGRRPPGRRAVPSREEGTRRAVPLLRSIAGPADVRALPADAAARAGRRDPRRAGQQRARATGGHLGPNLGVVELTIALHRVFDSPREPIVFDTGHQAYVHKMLTGRVEGFDRLASAAACRATRAGPRAEHDWVENSHASTALSYADGLAKAFAVRGDARPVVAVIGDGALTGGMAWEALNNIAAAQDRPVVIVVNDNGRSYSPTIGGRRRRAGRAAAAARATSRRCSPSGRRLQRAPVVGTALYDALHAHQEGPQGRPGAPGHVRGPRHEVRRPGRRARRPRRWSPRCGGPATSAAR